MKRAKEQAEPAVDFVAALCSRLKDLPDDATISAGAWSDPRPTGFPGIELPEFEAAIKTTLGELRKALPALLALTGQGKSWPELARKVKRAPTPALPGEEGH